MFITFSGIRMDGFGDSFVPPVDGSAGEVDPAAEFLAREQDQLAGLDDDIIPPAAPAAAPAQTDGSSPSPAPAAPGEVVGLQYLCKPVCITSEFTGKGMKKLFIVIPNSSLPLKEANVIFIS